METSDKQKNIIKVAMDDCDIKSTDIPSIDLYVDQILSLLSEKIAASSEPYHDKLLTKTMINNYSKDGLITPIKGKKYSKEQIVQTLLIYFLKGTLSMGEISRFFEVLYKDNDFTSQELVSFYDGFIDNKNIIREKCSEISEQFTKNIEAGTEDKEQILSSIMSLLCASSYLKTTATLLFNEYYPEPADDENGKDKEKDKDKDKEKEKDKKKDKKKS